MTDTEPPDKRRKLPRGFFELEVISNRPDPSVPDRRLPSRQREDQAKDNEA